MSESEPGGMTMGAKLFVGFLVVATAGLSILTVALSRQNRALGEELETMGAYLEKMEEKALKGGIIPGDLVEPLTLEDASGQPLDLAFGPGAPPTLLFLTSMGCGACDETIPVWEGALSEVGPIEPVSLRVVCVRAGALGDDLATPPDAMWRCYGTQPGHEGWLRRIPVAPSAVLLDPEGRVLHRWFGHMSETRAAEFRMAIADVAGV